MRLLPNHEVDVNSTAGYHRTALLAATESSNKKFVQLLVNRGADVNLITGRDNGTPLQAAVWRGIMILQTAA